MAGRTWHRELDSIKRVRKGWQRLECKAANKGSKKAVFSINITLEMW